MADLAKLELGLDLTVNGVVRDGDGKPPSDLEIIKYIDESKAAVPEEFRWSGRPLPEMVAELAREYAVLRAWKDSAVELEGKRADLAELLEGEPEGVPGASVTDAVAAMVKRLQARVAELEEAAKSPTLHQRRVMRFGKQMAAAEMREAAAEVLRNGTNTLPPPLRNLQGLAVLEWAVDAVRALPLPAALGGDRTVRVQVDIPKAGGTVSAGWWLCPHCGRRNDVILAEGAKPCACLNAGRTVEYRTIIPPVPEQVRDDLHRAAAQINAWAQTNSAVPADFPPTVFRGVPLVLGDVPERGSPVFGSPDAAEPPAFVEAPK